MIIQIQRRVIIYYLEALRVAVKEQSKSLAKGVVAVPKPNYKRDMGRITFKIGIPNKLAK
jgi:hypothetical protein